MSYVVLDVKQRGMFLMQLSVSQIYLWQIFMYQITNLDLRMEEVIEIHVIKLEQVSLWTDLYKTFKSVTRYIFYNAVHLNFITDKRIYSK